MIFRIINWFRRKENKKEGKELLCGWAMGFAQPTAQLA